MARRSSCQPGAANQPVRTRSQKNIFRGPAPCKSASALGDSGEVSDQLCGESSNRLGTSEPGPVFSSRMQVNDNVCVTAETAPDGVSQVVYESY